MATQQAKSIGKTDYAPPPIEGDFYRIAAVLNDSERTLLKRVREFTESVIAPVIEDYWSRDAFPFEIIPKMAEVGIGGVGYQGYGAAGGNWLLNGLVAMELARVDASVATFWGVQNGLITLSDCRVPEADRLQNASSFKDTAKVLRMTRTGVAWFAVGCQMGAYEHALRYATERTQFGRPIGGFQLVQDLLVRMLGNVTSTQSMMLRLGQLQDEGVMRDEHASLAKAFCTVKCRETVGYARELLGGNGILLENHIGRFVADAEAIYSYEGTGEMNTLSVGQPITGLSAFV